MVLLPDIEGGYIRAKLVRRRQDEGQIDVLSPRSPKIIADLQALSMAHHFVDGSETKLSHDRPKFICYIVKEVDNVLGLTGELLAEFRVLRSYAHGACI